MGEGSGGGVTLGSTAATLGRDRSPVAIWNLKEPVLVVRRLADEHAFQLLVEALDAAAQTRGQSGQRCEGDGNRLGLCSS